MSYPYGQPAYPGQYPPGPPQQYPPSQWSAPPPPQGYNQPPQGYYQSGPPPGPPQGYNQYGPPPGPPQGPPQGYNQYPQSQYPAVQQPYSQPYPPAPVGPPTPHTLGYGPLPQIQWDPTPDARALRGAMKGFGTDEKTLIRVLCSKDPIQIEAIKAAYFRNFSRTLEKDIISETRGWFEAGLVAIVRGPLLHDVHLLHSAMDGPGTKEKVLNDVLLSRSNADLNAIKNMYQQTFHRSLESTVKGDLSMKTERHFMIVLGANRAEDSAPVIPQAVDQDVMELYRATEGKLGTDEMMVCSILSTRNDNQIRAINYAYEQKFRRRLEDVIRKEFSGHMEEALLYQLRHAVDKYMHAAALLEDAMAGLGTKDHLLISRVVRYHWDKTMMANIKGAYQQRYHRSLAGRIKGETSGDYERLMLGCIGEPI
ncbi:Annexin [Daldinia caldariorum]|uniref:Annexin n=1 Tax=Daldinia caldariorum TaxID=326644 RepID=UPI002007446F|nr:Annexin [Daldinia caldariorum]KAI1470181.1 Annexin [Daldinia caldariorum]